MDLRSASYILNDTYTFAPVGSHTHMTQCSVATTLSAPGDATKLLIQATGSVDVRYTLDGVVVPTSTLGFVMVHDDPPIVIPVLGGTVITLIQEGANATIDYIWTGLPS